MKVTGIHSAEAALRAGQGICLTVTQGELNERQRKLIDIANDCRVEVQRGDIKDDGVAHQGVELSVREPAFLDHKMLAVDLQKGGQLYLLLDGVTDPRNFGACLRSAATFGVDGVIVPKDHSAPLNEAAIKTASGAASMLRLYRVTSLGRAMELLQNAGVWLTGTVLDDVPEISALDLTGRIGIVMGSEDSGMRQKTRERCDFLAQIPMPRAQLSLNVSVATGIALYEAARQRANSLK